MEIGKRYRDTKLRQLLENIYHGNREEIQRQLLEDNVYHGNKEEIQGQLLLTV